MNLTDRIAAARTVGGVPFSERPFPAGSLGVLLAMRAAEAPEREYLIYYDESGDRSSYTYRDFAARVQRVAHNLRARGAGRGDRIATVGHNHPDTVVQSMAAWWIGATVVPINAAEDPARIAFILDDARVRLAFVRNEYRGVIDGLPEALRSRIEVVDVGGPSSAFGAICREGQAEHLGPLDGLADAECLIVYTSGTTGNPKGVVLAHGNLMADAEGIARWHGVTGESRMMCVLPIHHVNGTVVTLATPLYAGGGVVLNRKFQSGTFFPRIAAEGVSIVSVVPTLLAYLVGSDIDTAQYDLSTLRHIICGAGPLTCELAERFETRYGVPIVHGYGLSETTCYSCFLPADLGDAERRSWLLDHGFPSIGVAIPENEMAIHDEQGNSLPEGARGEIVVRGHNVMQGYYNNPEANEAAFTHGWFRSGDEGFWLADRDGVPYYFITGRIKELIIRGGVNVAPLEIDEVLNSHPGIEAAIAVGFENNWYGEEIGAYVKRSDPTLDDEAILEWCRARLPWFKTPKVVVFGEEIPVTSTGKYQRGRVKHLFAEHRDVQFSDRIRS